MRGSNKLFHFQEVADFEKVTFINNHVKFQLTNGLIITFPLDLLPKIKKASKSERENFEIQGHFVFWDDVDEIIGVKNLLNGSIQLG